jgi:hypothetical protein
MNGRISSRPKRGASKEGEPSMMARSTHLETIHQGVDVQAGRGDSDDAHPLGRDPCLDELSDEVGDAFPRRERELVAAP